jgi:hypothetical protein
MNKCEHVHIPSSICRKMHAGSLLGQAGTGTEQYVGDIRLRHWTFQTDIEKNGRCECFHTIHDIDVEVVPISDGPIVYCRAKSISGIRYHALVHVHVHVNSCPCLGTSQYSCFRSFSHSCSSSCFMNMDMDMDKVMDTTTETEMNIERFGDP